jgi:hypothetical protein
VKVTAVALRNVHTWPSADVVADIDLRAGDADSSHSAPGPGHPKLRCFALGSLMGMCLLIRGQGCDVSPSANTSVLSLITTTNNLNTCVVNTV